MITIRICRDDEMRVHLSDLYDITSSKRVFQSEWRSAGVPFYRAREIARLSSNGYVNNELFIEEELYDEYVNKYGKPEAGDIMVTGVGTLGVCYVVKPEDKFYFKDGNILWFKQKAKDRILPEYLVKAFDSKDVRNFINRNSSGTTVGTLTIQTAKKLEITLPSIDEQKQIIERVVKIEKIIKERQQELQLLDDLIKARFVEMFGDLANPSCLWDKSKLIDVCANKDDIKCGPFGTQLNKNEYMESGIAVWEIPQINSAFLTKPTHFLTKEKAEQLKSYTIIPGDIAMSRKGNVGKCALFPDNYSEGIIHSDVLRIRVDCKRVNSLFMMYQLHFSRAVTRQIELVSSGAIMAGVNVTKLKQIYIHVPPIELQNQFANFVTQVDKSKLLAQIMRFNPVTLPIFTLHKRSEPYDCISWKQYDSKRTASTCKWFLQRFWLWILLYKYRETGVQMGAYQKKRTCC